VAPEMGVEDRHRPRRAALPDDALLRFRAAEVILSRARPHVRVSPLLLTFIAGKPASPRRRRKTECYAIVWKQDARRGRAAHATVDVTVVVRLTKESVSVAPGFMPRGFGATRFTFGRRTKCIYLLRPCQQLSW
jgi:hypothetical protein